MTPWTKARRAGLTLIEMILALVILGLMASVVAVAAGGDKDTRRDATDRLRTQVSAVRRQALRSGRPVVASVATDLAAALVPSGGETRGLTFLALPDGSVVPSPGLPIDRLTGTVVNGEKARAP